MGSYTARRILFALLTLFFITIIVFFTVVRIPESRLEDICEGIDVSEEGWDCMEAFTKILGLDQPFYLQYWNWMTGMVRGNFGQSIWTSRYVSDEMAKRFPVTFELVLLSFIFAHFVTVPLALLSTVWRIKAAAIISKILEAVFKAVPIFWLLTLLFISSIWWKWTPSQRYISFTTDWLTNLGQYTIPAVILGLYISGVLLGAYREILRNTLDMDCIRTAHAKGLRNVVVFMRHGLRNALVPILKKLAALLPFTLGLAIFIEETSILPGISRLSRDAIGQRDFPIISVTLFILAGVCLAVFLLTDLICAWLDPRIRNESLQEKFENP